MRAVHACHVATSGVVVDTGHPYRTRPRQGAWRRGRRPRAPRVACREDSPPLPCVFIAAASSQAPHEECQFFKHAAGGTAAAARVNVSRASSSRSGEQVARPLFMHVTRPSCTVKVFPSADVLQQQRRLVW